MMRCENIRAGLDDWLDNSADPGLRAEIDAHLADCNECARVFGRHRQLADDLLAVAGVADRMADAIKPVQVAAPPSRWRPLLGAAAFAALILVGVGLYLTRPWQDNASTQIAESVDGPTPITDQAASSRFHVAVPDNMMAVHVESANPRVHIVWLYHETLPSDASHGDAAGGSSGSHS
ncbi:MAG: zf-HC2 domain-containing protein [Phycisphaerae bacterium]|nr:zf-HC2 domain-containing protein [Phycisphaerae bacterium]